MNSQFRNLIVDSKYAAFGCSHTWGVGVEANETWPYLLSAKNYGIAGASADHTVRTACQTIATEQPLTIFVLWPDWARFEYSRDGIYHQSLPTDSDRIFFMETHTEQWCRQNFANNVKIMHDLCSKNNIKLIDITLYDLIPFLDHADQWPMSKLGHHYAPAWHKQVADLLQWAEQTNHKFPLSNE
jgi:hypothetical protein